MEDFNQYNISETYKYFFWAPPKTGSSHATWILNNFDFNYYLMSSDRKIIKETNLETKHCHTTSLFEGHENYKLICTARHPIRRIFSAFVFNNHEKKLTDFSKTAFIKFFIKQFDTGGGVFFDGIYFSERIPDYFLKTENLYEDYLKIPFIKESELNTSGKLREMCQEKKNSFHKDELNPYDYFTADMIDAVYYRYKKYFEILNYDPNNF